jgi:LacI family transcriptional regulator, galactose operon repressor
MTKQPTMKDIARLANVSVSTVSRVLNKHPDISATTTEEVLRAIEILNYRPNSRARQLVKKTAETICLILSNREVINSFHARILLGAEKYARKVGRNLIFTRFDYSKDVHPDNLQLPAVIWERGAADGLIIAGTNHPNLIRAVINIRVPFVVFGNNLTDNAEEYVQHSVWFDNEGGTYQATKHLIQLAHRNIWCAADRNLPWYRRCYEGFREAMQDNGLSPKCLDVAFRTTASDYGMECANQILAGGELPTGVVAGDDEIALGMHSVFSRNGINVPEDVSLVGFDDIDELKYFDPSLTTVHVDREQIGEELARLLFELIQDRDLAPTKRMIPTTLVVRNSSAPFQPDQSLTRQILRKM